MQTTTKTINELCNVVRETAYAIHVYHGHGHLEKVYENALAHRLRKMGLNVQQQPPIQVLDEDGTVLGDYNADLLIEHRLIVELKAARALADEHVAQLLGYLKSTRIEHGLLMNFGSYKFQIKKYIRTDQPKVAPSLGSLGSLGSGVLLAIMLVFSAFFRGSPVSSMQSSLPRQNTIEHKAEDISAVGAGTLKCIPALICPLARRLMPRWSSDQHFCVLCVPSRQSQGV
jgi:GxxExxY protein